MHTRCFYKNLSIMHKMILLYIIIITICISILTGIIASNSTKAIREIAENSADQVMLSTYRSMTAQVDDINYIFAILQANKSLQTALCDNDPANAAYNVAVIDDILFEIDVYGKRFSRIELYALNHPEYSLCVSEHVFSDKVIANTSDYAEVLANGVDSKWFANDNNYASSSSITAMKTLIDSYTDEPLAVVRIDIDTTQFVNSLQNLRLADTGRIFLCTLPLHIINPYENKFVGALSHNRDLRLLLDENKIDTVYTTVDAEDYMLTTYPLPDMPFYLVGAARLSEFKTKALALRNAAFITAVIMILVIILLLYYVSCYISEPIIRLTKNIDSFSPDNPQTAQYDNNDELGQLYRSFNAMQARIVKLTDSLCDSLTLQKKAELKAIQAQISPHFLYNTLNSISALAQKHNIEEIEYMTSSLATFFTRTLNNGNTFCTIRDELVHIQSYVNIQNIRFSNMFKIVTDMPEELLDCTIINLTLQPLVENCIIHAFRGKTNIGTISISGRRCGSDVYIDVADDGLGANIIDVNYLNQYVNKPFNFDEQIEQYGIHNVSHRIKLYYGNMYGLSYTYNESGGLTATVHISTDKKGV